VVEDNVCLTNEFGIRLSSANSNYIVDNVIHNNSHGIHSHDSHFNDISKNNFEFNTRFGIYLFDSNDNTMHNNSMSSNAGGLYIFSSNDNEVRHNTFRSSSNVGLELFYADDNSIFHNIIGNNDLGIELNLSDSNNITHNAINHNRIGIFLIDHDMYDWCKDNTIHENEIHMNMEFGIMAECHSKYRLDAEKNSWGDPSGPFNTKRNPNGMGDSITNDVDFSPWIDGNGTEHFSEEDEDGGTEGFISGFGLIGIIVSIAISLAFKRKTRA